MLITKQFAKVPRKEENGWKDASTILKLNYKFVDVNTNYKNVPNNSNLMYGYEHYLQIFAK